jgi:hypothetical protein
MAETHPARATVTRARSDLPVLAVTVEGSPAAALAAEACCAPKALHFARPAPGSRRRRLWELDTSAHCPVLGVCLPIDLLRRQVAKALPVHAGDDDYRQHCIAVSQSRHRGALAEALHKALEQRFPLALREAAAARSTEELATWWRRMRGDERMPGALWATLTHPRCDTALADKVLADVHMLQHQLGAAQRVDLKRFDALQAENGALRAELDALRLGAQRQAAALRAQLDRAQAHGLRLQAEAIGRHTAMAALRDELQALQTLAPGLQRRAELARRVQAQAERIAGLERALRCAQQQAERAVPPVPSDAPTAPPAEPPAAAAAALLDDRAVLCVGGRPASVPLYRHIVERSGGRFLHHDGGDEHGVQRLDATLSAADLVICQTGCISHDAYWRVKEHCKRHGKRCVFVDNPGSASLRRALAELKA